MNKPLLLTVASDTGYSLHKIIIDMDKIVAMYEEQVKDRNNEGQVNNITRLLPTAGRHLQVVERMGNIMTLLYTEEQLFNGDPSSPPPEGEVTGSVLIETHRCSYCDADCTGIGIHQCDQCPGDHQA